MYPIYIPTIPVLSDSPISFSHSSGWEVNNFTLQPMPLLLQTLITQTLKGTLSKNLREELKQKSNVVSIAAFIPPI